MTDQAKAKPPLVRDYYAPHAREELVAAMKQDYPAWIQNTPINQFREKFRFPSASATRSSGIYVLSEGTTNIEDCEALLREIAENLKGTVDEPDVPFPRLILCETKDH